MISPYFNGFLQFLKILIDFEGFPLKFREWIKFYFKGTSTGLQNSNEYGGINEILKNFKYF